MFKLVILIFFAPSGLGQNGFNYPSSRHPEAIQFGDGFFSFVPRSINGFNVGNQAIPQTTDRPGWNQFVSNNNPQNTFANQNQQGGSSQQPNQNPWFAPNQNGNQQNDRFSNQNFQGNEHTFQNQNVDSNQLTTRRFEIEAPTTERPRTTPRPSWNNNFAGNQQGAIFQNFAEPDNACVTLDGSIGSCIDIRSCPPYVSLLKSIATNPHSPARSILQKAHCGFDGNYPKVCCPKSQPIPTGSPIVEPQNPPTEEPKNPQTPEPRTEPTVEEPPEEPDAISQYVVSLPEPPICGKNNESASRVVGGRDAKLGQFPWMALLGYHSARYPDKPRWLCGGSLVTNKHVLTAAHCIHGREKDLYLVRLGELDISRDDDGASPIDVPIKEKFKHEAYSAKSFTNDIGVLLLERSVHFTDLIKPICLPKSKRLRSLTFEKYNPFIAGWGDTEFRGPAAPHLQLLQLPVVSNELCADAYKNYKAQVIDHRVLCAGFKEGGKDACQGDSGGPLMQTIFNPESLQTHYFQIGVVSYGRKCAEAGFPGVYTRTTHFMPWLYKQIVGKEMP